MNINWKKRSKPCQAIIHAIRVLLKITPNSHEKQQHTYLKTTTIYFIVNSLYRALWLTNNAHNKKNCNKHWTMNTMSDPLHTLNGTTSRANDFYASYSMPVMSLRRSQCSERGVSDRPCAYAPNSCRVDLEGPRRRDMASTIDTGLRHKTVYTAPQCIHLRWPLCFCLQTAFPAHWKAWCLDWHNFKCNFKDEFRSMSMLTLSEKTFDLTVNRRQPNASDCTRPARTAIGSAQSELMINSDSYSPP